MFTVAISADMNFRNATVFHTVLNDLCKAKDAVCVVYNSKRTSKPMQKIIESISGKFAYKVAPDHKVLAQADALIAFWDNANEWTQRTINDFKRSRKPVRVIDYKALIAELRKAARDAYEPQRIANMIELYSIKIEVDEIMHEQTFSAILDELAGYNVTLEDADYWTEDRLGCAQDTRPNVSKVWEPSKTTILEARMSQTTSYAEYKALKARREDTSADSVRTIGAGSERVATLRASDCMAHDERDLWRMDAQNSLDRIKADACTKREIEEITAISRNQWLYLRITKAQFDAEQRKDQVLERKIGNRKDYWRLAIKSGLYTARTHLGEIDLRYALGWAVPGRRAAAARRGTFFALRQEIGDLISATTSVNNVNTKVKEADYFKPTTTHDKDQYATKAAAARAAFSKHEANQADQWWNAAQMAAAAHKVSLNVNFAKHLHQEQVCPVAAAVLSGWKIKTSLVNRVSKFAEQFDPSRGDEQPETVELTDWAFYGDEPTETE